MVASNCQNALISSDINAKIMRINIPSKFHCEELAELFSRVVFTKGFEYLIRLFALLNILTDGIIIIFLWALKISFSTFYDLNAYAARLDCADIMLVLHVVADVDGRCVYLTRGKGINNLLFDFVRIHDEAQKNAWACGIPVPSANGQINPTHPYTGNWGIFSYLLKVLPTYWKRICLVKSICPPFNVSESKTLQNYCFFAIYANISAKL